MKRILLPLLIFFCSVQVNATNCTATRNGDWDRDDTWSCGHMPACGDSVLIPAGLTVTIDDQADYTACGSPNFINIYGTLTFVNGKKLMLPCGSEIIIQVGGTVSGGGGGGSSNLIDICGVTVWRSEDGDLHGFKVLPNEVMPIELKTFYALPQGHSINIHWESATETNNKEYTIEQSTDGLVFKTLAVVPSKAVGGNSLATLVYDYTDSDPIGGTSYYRLKQTDYNGKFEYFQVISVDFEESKHITFTVFPNPNQGQFTVDFTGVENNHEIEVIMYDQGGKLAYQKNITSESLATNTFSIIPEHQIASGIYMVNFVVEGIKYPVKVIVQ